jgi:chromosomal replication initiation ATPase DnaA
VRASFATDLVALATRVLAAQIRIHKRNNARAARARQMPMHLAHVSSDRPRARAGAAFGRDRTTAGHGCRLIEDLRADPAIDTELEGWKPA